MNSKFVKLAISAFLVINIVGWALVARSRSDSESHSEQPAAAQSSKNSEPAGGEIIQNAAPKPFSLQGCKQVNVEPGGFSVLELSFNAEPDTNSVLSRLSFTEDGKIVPYSVRDVKKNKMTVRIDSPAKTELLSATLKKGATGTKSVPSTANIILGCPVSSVFILRGVNARQITSDRIGVSLEFNKFVDAGNPGAEYITFDPPVDFSLSRDYQSGHWGGGDDHYGYSALLATGDFAPSTEYKVTVAEGLSSEDGSLTVRSQTKTIKTPDISPSVNVPSFGRYLAPTGNLLVPVETINVTNVAISAERLLPQNIVQFVVRERDDLMRWYGSDDEDNSELLTVPENHEDFPIQSVKNEKKTTACSLRKSIGEAERGIYLVTVQGKANGRELNATARVVCISDIGISAFGVGGNFVLGKISLWITSLSTGKSRGGVEVSLYSTANELLDRGTSDENGLLTLRVPDQRELAVVVARDVKTDDMSFLAINNSVNIPSNISKEYITEGKYEAFVFSDREIYRPGETAFFQILVRDHNAVAPKSFPLELAVFKPNSDLLSTISVMPDERGSVHQDITFSEFLPSGTYTINAKLPGKNGAVIGSHRVTVESFVPPQVRASVETDKKVVNRGENVRVTVSAEHLYGAPAEGLKAEVSVLFENAGFAPAGWEKFSFDDPVIQLNTFRLAEKTIVLNAEGKGDVEFTVPETLRAPSRVKAVVSCRVFENGGRTVSAFTKVMVDNAPFYLGIAKDFGGAVSLGSEIRVPWAAVYPDGTPVTNAANVTARLVKIDSHWSFVTGDHGSTSWHCERTETVVMKDFEVPPAGANGIGEFRFAVSEYGDYRLDLWDGNAGISTSRQFWASWWENGVSPSALDSFSKLEVKTDKKEYLSGEQARITVTAPFTGDLRIALMKDEVLKSYVIPMTNKTVDIVLPVSEKCAPNIQVLATLVRETKPEAIWAPHRAIGRASVKVLPRDRILKVAVEVPELIKPAKVADVTVRVSGKEAADARVTLLAVDEGICGLTAMETPDPLSCFFAERAEYIWYYDVYSRLMQVTDEKLTGFVSHIGGGFADGAARARLSPISARRFKPVALKTYDVELKDGVAVIPVAVPEFTGRLRFMAIVWTASSYGSATAFANVHRDVVIQSDMPRMLAPGDQSYLSIALNNTLKSAAEITIDISCDGPVSVTDSPGKIVLPAGVRKNLTVPVKAAEGVGVGKVLIKVTGEGTDYSDEIEIPVRPAAAWNTRAKSTAIPAGETAVFEPESGVIEATAAQKFELLPCPAADIRSAFEYLRGYPYGCLEQTTSGAYPYLIIPKLPEGYFDEAELADASDVINTALARLYTMCRWNGFSMWPDYSEVARFETLYALQFIAEAQRSGYGKDLLFAYRGNVSKALSCFVEDWRNYYRDKCYAAMDLALFGIPEKAFMARLREECGTASGEARAMLARAYLLCGEPAVATEILTDLPVTDNLRSASFLLVALSALNPSDPRCLDCVRVINEALDQRVGHWGTTQDNAIAINALASYLAVAGEQKSSKTVSATLKVKNGEKEDTIVFPVGKKANWASAEGQGNARCEITNTGDGLLYVRRETRAVPQASALPPVANGLTVTREYLTRDGVAVDSGALQRGSVVIVKLTVTSPETHDDLVIEDLLPACLEVEKVNLFSSVRPPWFAPNDDGDWVIHHEARDDRLLLFGKIGANKTEVWYYQTRVVSAGEYIVPAIQASAMYAPDVISRGKASTMKVAF